MSAQKITLLDSQTVAAGGPGAWKDVGNLSMADVVVDVSAATTTLALDVWLEGYDQLSQTAYAIPADVVMKHTTAAAGNAATTDARDIVDNKTTTTAERFVARYKHLPASRVRLNWSFSGSGDVTMSAGLNGK